MGTSKRFFLKFAATAGLFLVLFCEGFILYCEYVKHVDTLQYASEKFHAIQERFDSSGTQTANAQASEISGAAKESNTFSAAHRPDLFFSAKDAVSQMIHDTHTVSSGNEGLSVPEEKDSDSGDSDTPETSETPNTEKAQKEEKRPAEKNTSTSKISPIPAESADPTGMKTTDINELLERQRKDGLMEHPDSKIQLETESILQEPELPTGCEVTALTMALHYCGYSVSKEKLADRYLEKAQPGTVSYRTAFWGDPRKEDSFGCYAPVITKAANQFLAKKKSPCMAYNLTGTSFDDLLKEIRMGYPVIVWGCMYINGEIVFSYGWEIQGETVTWPSNEHCMLLIGFDMDTNSVIVCDPLAGVVSYDKSAFQHHYETLEQQAIVIY